MKKILFVCKYNRFRSKVAEAFFKKYNKNKKIEVKSAGVIRGRPLDKNQVSAARKEGITIEGNPVGLSSELLIWQDAVIIVADDVPKNIFNQPDGKKLIVWEIPDAKSDNTKEVERIIRLIRDKVVKLTESLI